ncbi:transcriptional regulator [Boudabousia liubingyangii]|uniref:Transcriptional regulator n=1 Tax=Boudabousia liubingyangii TaxID=1921764 RepID=A0A1Q5PL89_9ACTO|nr:metalloregulator ArsR/SmtB family transcription factor [Boudabousia liubingyangii]OKL47109.1 transcriptional regulator [Boudabousia liubingyangii]OKL47825.1 transcriptional regulator [Boudabousia liubingyangii]
MNPKVVHEKTSPQRECAPVVPLFKALAHPVRTAIVHRLVEGPADVSQLVELVEESQPLVSHHLKVLRDAHLVRINRVGRNSHYELIDEHVARIFMDAFNHAKEHDHDCKH